MAKKSKLVPIIEDQRRAAGLLALDRLNSFEEDEFFEPIPDPELDWARAVLLDNPLEDATRMVGYEPAALHTLVHRFLVRWATLEANR